MEEKEELLCQAGGERAKRLIQIGCDLDSLGARSGSWMRPYVREKMWAMLWTR